MRNTEPLNMTDKTQNPHYDTRQLSSKCRTAQALQDKIK